MTLAQQVAMHSWNESRRIITSDSMAQSAKDDYKPMPAGLEDSLKVVSEARDEIRREAQSIKDRLDDPVVIGALMHRTVVEKENTNRILKNISEMFERLTSKLNMLEGRIARLEQGAAPAVPAHSHERLLGDVDDEVLTFVRERGRACAAEVQKRFNYRGTNAASARLSRLYELGLLEKQQAGRKVYYQSK